MKTSYRIRRSFLVPLALDALLLFILLVISYFSPSHPVERIMLTLMFVPLLYVVVEVIVREVSIDKEGMRVKKLLRCKTLNWGEISNIDTIVLRKKVYLTVTTAKGFFVISNSYGNFTKLVTDIIEQLSVDKVEARVRDVVSTPIRKIADIVGAWLAAILLVAIIYTKLFVS